SEEQWRLDGRSPIPEVGPNPVQAIRPLAWQRLHDIDPPAVGEMGRGACFVERRRLRADGPVTELHGEVATIRAKRLGPHHFHLFAEEHGLAIANPEGGE